ncbi:ankyrin repeat domain-containing protein [Actinomyces howellii]|uniref:Ribulose-5-phosphate 4-epimerase and related epimerases and aldolases n=1 Tax=Actinomyces howellii TaxID=52771 RepID=A0A3S4UYZ4_9ACTO|nr:ankyrin repeat domain-containing protein [Actinomyces howellii]VEG29762.1 Ribulose-5-phosphate 4-epimerase and related epimerases and aldolases [Actinomyces howellii]
MARLRQTLPPQIEVILASGDLDEVASAMARCRVGAVSNDHARQTALHIVPCPNHVVEWLVERGEDVNAEDRYGKRPLHSRATPPGHAEQIPLLLRLGAEVDAADHSGRTALHLACQYQRLDAVELLLAAGADATRTASIPGGTAWSTISCAVAGAASRDMAAEPAVRIIERLVVAGARPTGAESEPLRSLGKDLQRRVARGVRDEQTEAQARALDRLYEICDVPPVEPIRIHDDVSRIEVPETVRWQRAYSALWDSLVPDRGRAATAQGEAVRIIGRIGYEILTNGGCNWDRTFMALVDGLSKLLGTGTPLPPAELDEARGRLQILRTAVCDEHSVDRVTELTVEWVRLNPEPAPNPLPDVGR